MRLTYHSPLRNRVQFVESVTFGFLIALAFGIVIPISSILTIGPDEHFETAKGWLAANQWVDLPRMWNDQPTLLTLLLAGLYTFTGPSILAGRLLAAIFMLTGISSLYYICRKSYGRIPAVAGVIVLIGSPLFLNLGLSPMGELPALSLALASTACAMGFRSGEHGPLRPLLISALLFAGALNIKLTAIICAPLVLTALWHADRRTSLTESLERAPSPAHGRGGPLFWLLVTCLFSLLIWVACPNAPLSEHITSHLGSAVTPEVLSGPTYTFRLVDLLGRPDYVLLVIAFLLTALLWDLTPGWWFAFVLLGTVAAVHMYHRPWWAYYWVHFATAFAFVAAWLVALFLRRLATAVAHSSGRRTDTLTVSWLVATSILLSILFYRSALTIVTSIKTLRGSDRLADSEDLRLVASTVPPDAIVYCSDTKFIFLAGRRFVPELTVLPQKRVWSGELGRRGGDVLSILKAHQPTAVIVTSNAELIAEWKVWLQREFVFIAKSDTIQIYLRSSPSIPASDQPRIRL